MGMGFPTTPKLTLVASQLDFPPGGGRTHEITYEKVLVDFPLSNDKNRCAIFPSTTSSSNVVWTWVWKTHVKKCLKSIPN